ncbi:MAG TPA: sulfatase-like hydrolase/transferase, partial [Gemmataceae bacterium]|nr:sulfatase-like hydrolase/transferase [Gemmataceae bacterium]
NLESLTAQSHGPTLSIAKPAPPAKQYNVLLLQAETLNAEVFNQTDLEFLNKFKKKCVRLNRHFSVANATHYGILGLLHGNPVTFFTGPRKYYRTNPYLEHFKDHGYKTRLITGCVLQHHKLGHYLPNFTEPPAEPPGSDFDVVPLIHEELAKPGPRFVYSFYHATHYPYNHGDDSRYQKYLPEVEYEFNYNRSNLMDWKEQIVNRYKNSLLRMDDWYRDILAKVDLDNTIVVITGDHGEEFFSQGRLGHCSSLNIHQTMTPCFVYIPGVEPTDVTFVTSHADILPTIAEALGHEKTPESLGQSLFASVSFRYAILSHFEYWSCMLWAIATEDRMTVFERDYQDNVQITGLTDWKGVHIPYRPEASQWDDRFRVIRRVEEQLKVSREVVPTGEK